MKMEKLEILRDKKIWAKAQCRVAEFVVPHINVEAIQEAIQMAAIHELPLSSIAIGIS
jgi:hypothetical protein